MIELKSKLANSQTSIFSVVSQLSTKHNAINLGQGFPNFDCDPKLIELVHKHLKNGKNQYAPMPGVPVLTEAIAKKINTLYSNDLDASTEITITSGATQAIFSAITAFVSRGDEVIIFEPAYDCYKPTIELNGGMALAYEMEGPDFKVDWDQVESMISENCKMIIINTPHNPTGKIFTEEDMRSLESLVTGKNIIVLSDEVYEHLIYNGFKHQSALKFPDLFQHSLSVFSFGKTFHNTGWKMGYIVGPKYLMDEFRKTHQWTVFSSNSFIQFALAEYLEDSANYENLPRFYQTKRDYFNNLMKDSKLRPVDCHGTYFQLFDYSEISNEDDMSFMRSLIIDHGVASIPVSAFYGSRKQNKVIRLCFAKTEDVLSQAAERLCKI